MSRRLILAALLLGAGVAGTHAADTRRGVVVYVVDGDTYQIDIEGAGEKRVRARGFDTPEKGDQAKCAGEAVKAAQATKEARRLLPPGTVVALSQFGVDPYGRTLASVTQIDGADMAKAMIAAGLAHPYQGGRKRSWCP